MYCWQRVIRRMETLSLAVPLVSFDKRKGMPAPSFPFTLTHLTFNTHTQHSHINSSLTSSHTYKYSQSCNVACRSGVDIENGSHLASIYSKEGLKPRVQKNKTKKNTHIIPRRRQRQTTPLIILPSKPKTARITRSLTDPTDFIIIYISGVAKLFDSPSNFSKFEIFPEPQLNTYLKRIQTRYLKKLQKLYLLKTYK